MHHLSSPFPSLTTASKRTPRPASDTSTSPPSSRTTSPPSSPTSSHGHHNQPHNQNHQNHLFNLSFHPHNHNHNHAVNQQPTRNPKDESRSQQTHPATSPPDSPPQCGISILPCAILRGRSSMMVLRRRPSAVDMALTEERSRCDGDAIERQGLDLMEPRPVDMNITMNGNGHSIAKRARASLGGGGEGRTGVQQPRFVMGGIFEVMEGRA